MMSEVTVELCPETGICSIIKDGSSKVDLIPGEVEALRAAQGDAEKLKSQIGEIDSVFSAQLSDENLSVIAAKLQ